MDEDTQDDLPMPPHNALRIIEAKLHKVESYAPTNDPVWAALDRLWDYVVLGDNDM